MSRPLATAAPTAAPVPFPLAPLLAALALGAVAFAPGFRDMAERWLAPGSYYGHGPLVPLASAWIVWREREGLREVARGSSALGLAVLFLAVAILAGSVVEDIHFTQSFALVLAVLGVALVLFGGAVVKRLWFAFAYLIFMVPIPEVAIANLTFTLKILAAKIAVRAIDLAGIPVVLDGSTIHLPSTSLTVDDVCSGLRTLTVLVAIAFLFAYLERTRWKAILTVALAGPIAIMANAVRILVLCGLAAIGSSAAREGPGHEATGLAVYVVALLLLMGIRALPGGAPEPAPPAAPATAPRHARPPRGRVFAMLLLLASGAACSLVFAYQPAAEKTHRTAAIPAAIGAWSGTDLPIGKRVYELLETEDILMRRYRRPADRAGVDLYVVHAADSRKVAHPPEICFSGGGYAAPEKGERAIAGPRGPIPAIRMLLAHEGGETLLVYYWYRLDGRDTASYLGHQLETVFRQIRRERHEGSMVRLSTPVGPDGVAGAEARIAAFGREALGKVLEAIP